MNAVITGGTKGIGRAIVERFAKTGYKMIVCARNPDDLENLKSELPEAQITTFQCDMSKKEEVSTFGEFVLSTFDSVDILVNNAGVFLPGMVHAEEDGTLEKQIETNLYSAYNMTRALVSKMMEKGKGHIFNMCSIASQTAYPNGGSYSISKFALLGFSKVLREELKDKGIRVTAILPGGTWSNSWAGVDLPQSRLMAADDVAIAVSAAIEMSDAAVMEEIVLRPQLGDL